MSDTKAISTELNLSDAAKALREKIQTAFVELIPPEQWESMVRNELTAFTKGRKEPKWNGSHEFRDVPSIFQSVCEEVYRAHVKALVKAELEKPEWNQGWGDHNGPIVSKSVKEWLTENSERLLQTVLHEMFAGAAQRLVESIRHS